MKNQILLSDLFTKIADNEREYKIHFAVKSDIEPLDVYSSSFDEWTEWNKHKGGRNNFSRKYIFSLINFYTEIDTWLFGGIFEVLDRSNERYEIKLIDNYKEYIGRLKIAYTHKDRNVRRNMEGHFNKMIVKEILEKKYDVMSFTGYQNVDISFSSLEKIVNSHNISWKNALQQVKGIYLIIDIKSGKRYVGSANSENGGFWQRWSSYIENGHGGNLDLRKLVEEKGVDYVKQNYKFTILEYIGTWQTDNYIFERETYWKRVLLSRLEDFGHNKN